MKTVDTAASCDPSLPEQDGEVLAEAYDPLSTWGGGELSYSACGLDDSIVLHCTTTHTGECPSFREMLADVGWLDMSNPDWWEYTVARCRDATGIERDVVTYCKYVFPDWCRPITSHVFDTYGLLATVATTVESCCDGSASSWNLWGDREPWPLDCSEMYIYSQSDFLDTGTY